MRNMIQSKMRGNAVCGIRRGVRASMAMARRLSRPPASPAGNRRVAVLSAFLLVRTGCTGRGRVDVAVLLLGFLHAFSALVPTQSTAAPHASANAGEKVVEFDLDRTGDVVLVPVRFSGGETHLFLLSTGTAVSAYDAKFEERLRPDDSATVERAMHRRADPRVAFLGPFALPRLSRAPDLTTVREVVGHDVYGFIGMDFLKDHVLTLDYGKGRGRITPAASLDAGDEMPLLFTDDGLPFVRAHISGGAGELFLVHTASVGIGTEGHIRSELSARLVTAGLSERIADAGFSTVSSATQKGTELTVSSATRRGATLMLCDLAMGPYRHMRLALSESNKPSELGTGYWSRYIVTFDFPRRRMFLKKSGRFDAAAERDKSGLHLLRVDGRIVIKDVDEGSPAAEAGVRPGDVVLSVAGLDTSRSTLRAVRLALCAERDATDITLQRSERTFSISLTRVPPGEARAARTPPAPSDLAVAAPRLQADFPLHGDGAPWVVDATVGGKRCRLMLDTGATCSGLHSAHRAALGERREVLAVEGPEQVYLLEAFAAPLLEIGGATLRPTGDFVCLDLEPCLDASGRQIDGFIGMDVLRNEVFSVDFDAGRLRFHSAADPSFGARVPIICRNDHWAGLPFVRAVVADDTEEFLIDSGDHETISGSLEAQLYDRLARGGRLSPVISTFPASNASRVGTASDPEMARADLFSLGGSEHRGLVFRKLASASRLSVGYLSRYSIQFDFPNSVLYVRRGRHFGQQDDYLVSGLKVRRDSNRLIVVGVQPHCAAESAGVRPGDALGAIDGRKVEGGGLYHALRRLATPGSHVLELTRDGTSLHLTLILGSEPRAPDECDRSKGEK